MPSKQRLLLLIGLNALLIGLFLEFVTLPADGYRPVLLGALVFTTIADTCFLIAWRRGHWLTRAVLGVLLIPSVFIVADFAHRAPSVFASSLDTREYNVWPTFHKTMLERYLARHPELRPWKENGGESSLVGWTVMPSTYLKDEGMSFEDGASVMLLQADNLLILRNSFENHRRLQTLLDTVKKDQERSSTE